MWVIGNGAPKTGSTWPMKLLRATRRFENIPESLQKPRWGNSCVRDDLGRQDVDKLATSATWYLSKQHWHDEKKEYLGIAGVKLLNSIRDIRDTFVSRYYHDVRKGKFSGLMEEYVEQRLSGFTRIYCNYQKYWMDACDESPESYYILSYERLSLEYEDATRELLQFCDINLDGDEFNVVLETGRFSSRDSGPGKFHRKGKVHAFSDDLTDRSAAQLLEFATERGLLETKRRIANFNPNLAPFLEMTDVGL